MTAMPKTASRRETEDERNERLAAARKLRATKERAPDPRDLSMGAAGFFLTHNCNRCRNGDNACVHGNPSKCEWPGARTSL